jgi:VWFA-related protein
LVTVSLLSQTTVPDSGNAVTTVQAKVRVVLVDVVVTSSKGDSVTGLHQGDFEVFEGGKPQTIASFTEHQGAPPTQIKLPPMPPNVYTNDPLTQTADSVNVLLLDALNTPARSECRCASAAPAAAVR